MVPLYAHQARWILFARLTMALKRASHFHSKSLVADRLQPIDGLLADLSGFVSAYPQDDGKITFQFPITDIKYDPIEIIAQCVTNTSTTFSKTPVFGVKLSELDLVRMIE